MMVVPEIMNPGRCVDECIPLDFIISAISIPVCWFSTVYISTALSPIIYIIGDNPIGRNAINGN
jgi:hypothetical protein